MVTRSLRKALVFCESNSLRDDIHVQVRVIHKGKKHTYLCTPSQALETMLFKCDKFIWFKPDLCA